MSIALMTAAFKAHLNSTHKFVLVALCDNANDQGECYPSIPMLASKTSLSDRAVQKSIAVLIEQKYLKRDLRNGRSNYYYIADPRTWFTPEPCSPPNDVHHTPERRSPPPPNMVHPTPERGSPITINESSIEPSGKHQGLTLPAWLPMEAWNGYLEMRKKKRKDPTEYALKLVLGDLAKFHAEGHDVEAILASSIKNAWTDVYAPKTPAKAAPAGTSKLSKAGQVTAANAMKWLEEQDASN